MMSLQRKCFILIKWNILILSFVNYTFGIMSKKYLTNLSLKRFPPIFSSRHAIDFFILLKYIWFTVLYWCLLYSKVTQLYIYIHKHILFHYDLSQGIKYSLFILIVFLFYGWVIFHCIYIPHILYPFLYWWTFRLLLCFCYCKQCWNEHWGAYILSDHVFLWIYAQECDCRVIW